MTAPDVLYVVALQSLSGKCWLQTAFYSEAVARIAADRANHGKRVDGLYWRSGHYMGPHDRQGRPIIP